MDTQRENLRKLRERIKQACQKSQRNIDDITLVAVSKRHSTDSISHFHDLGMRTFGESYVGELEGKVLSLSKLEGLHWHFIGQIQSNKIKRVVALGATIESVSSLRAAKAIGRFAAERDEVTEIFLQVNIGNEPQKGGCDIADLASIIAGIGELTMVRLRGLMAIPPAQQDPEASRPYFRALRDLGEQHGIKEYSMGMSRDFDVAIEEGATLVRVGTALFGPRQT